MFLNGGRWETVLLVRVERVYGFCFKEFHSFRKNPSHSAHSRSNSQIRVLVIPTPTKKNPFRFFFKWWALGDSNSRPSPCKGDALPTELNALLVVLTVQPGASFTPELNALDFLIVHVQVLLSS